MILQHLPLKFSITLLVAVYGILTITAFFFANGWGYKETRKFASDNNFLSSWRKMLKIFYYDNNADKFAYVRPNAQIILSIKANSHIKYLTPLYKFF